MGVEGDPGDGNFGEIRPAEDNPREQGGNIVRYNFGQPQEEQQTRLQTWSRRKGERRRARGYSKKDGFSKYNFNKYKSGTIT